MSVEQVHEPQNHEGISGKFIKLQFIDPHMLRTFLDGGHPHTELYKSDEMASEHINGASLSVQHEPGEDLHILGHIEFNPQSVTPDWTQTIDEGLREVVDNNGKHFDYYCHPHELNSVYVRINKNNFVRIATDVNIDQYEVNMSLVPYEKFATVYEQHGPVEYPLVYDVDGLEPADNYETLKSFGRIWGRAIDCALSEPSTAFSIINIEAPKVPEAQETTTEITVIPKIRVERSLEQANRISFEDIGGLHAAKGRLRLLSQIINKPMAATLYGIPIVNHVLIHGPEGTGKSLLVEAFANSINAVIHEVDAGELLGSYYGKSTENTLAKFDAAIKAGEHGNVVMWFKNFQDIADANMLSKTAEQTEVIEQKLHELKKSGNRNIVLVAETQADPSELSSRVVGKGKIEPLAITLPNLSERVEIWRTLYNRTLCHFDETEAEMSLEQFLQQQGDTVLPANDFLRYDNERLIDFETLAERSEGLSGRQIGIVFEEVRQQAVDHAMQTNSFDPISFRQLFAQLQITKRQF